MDELVIFLGRAIEEVRLRREARALRNAMRKDLSPAGLLGRTEEISSGAKARQEASRTMVD